MQAVGGAIGLSCLVTLALRHAASQVRDGVPAAIASTHGYSLAFQIGSALMVIGGVLVLVLLEHVIATPRNPQAEITAVAAYATTESPRALEITEAGLSLGSYP
jgi:hypothetical protein